MSASYEVAVLGGGLAGRMAALSAAQENASVVLLTNSESPLQNSTGLIDFLGYLPGRPGPLVDPFDSVDDLPRTHPYSIMGEGTIREAFQLFDKVTKEAFLGGHTDRNGLITTQMGSAKPAARYPLSFASGLLSKNDSTLYLGIEGLLGLDGDFIAAGLSTTSLPYAIRGANIDIFAGRLPDQPRLRLATALDRNESWEEHEGTIREHLASTIRSVHQGESRIGLPAILGRRETGEIREELSERLGVNVFEYPTDPPSLPGVRLADILDKALAETGVERRDSSTIVTYSVAGNTIDELSLSNRAATINAAQYVLATGGLAEGGILERDGKLVERVFDLPIARSEALEGGVDPDPLAMQEFARAGLRTDSSLRPIAEDTAQDSEDADLSSRFSNLRAAGSVLGGFDFVAEHSRSGIAITTGVSAGRAAAKEVHK